ncbi:MAG: efflux RND transporter periplasmic adaptor subunit, partial [Chromatiaceae bacterium]
MTKNSLAAAKIPSIGRFLIPSPTGVAQASRLRRGGPTTLALLLVSALVLSGCDIPHGHDHEEPHADEHGDANGHDGGHGHGAGAIAVTHFTDRTELFVEFPPLVVGEESGFAAHLTRLDDFRPVGEGRVTVRLSGGGLPEESFSVDAPSIPGIFRPVAQPTQVGERSVALILESPDLNATHDLGTYSVYSDPDAAAAAQPAEEDAGDEIGFLKEQQWKVEFATAAVERRRMRASVTATGLIRARKDGEALV